MISPSQRRLWQRWLQVRVWFRSRLALKNPDSWLIELLPNDVICAKETRFGDWMLRRLTTSLCACVWLVYLCCLCHFSCRVYTFDIIGSEWDMRARVKEDNSPGAYYWRIEGTVWLWIESFVGWWLTLWYAQRLGFDAFTTKVEDVLKDHKQQQKVCIQVPISERINSLIGVRAQDREKKVSKLEQSGMTEDELLEAQQKLFAQSRAIFESNQQQRWLLGWWWVVCYISTMLVLFTIIIISHTQQWQWLVLNNSGSSYSQLCANHHPGTQTGLSRSQCWCWTDATMEYRSGPFV